MKTNLKIGEITKRKKNIRLTTDYEEKIPERINYIKGSNGNNFYLVSWKGRDIVENS